MKTLPNPQILKRIGAGAAFAVLIITGLAVTSQRGRADREDSEESKIRIGLRISPVVPNLRGKDPDLVGLGSYIVNAQSDCNGCHSLSPQAEFVFGGIPYFGQHPTVVNPKVYLGGGQDFGTLDPDGKSAHIVSRNLTPDKTGRPEGGATYEQFVDHIRKGKDDDNFHPTCKGGSLNAHCVPAPFDGSLLQIMPWPIYANMTGHELRAIYEYLSSIPCLEGDPGNPAGSDTHGKRCK